MESLAEFIQSSQEPRELKRALAVQMVRADIIPIDKLKRS